MHIVIKDAQFFLFLMVSKLQYPLNDTNGNSFSNQWAVTILESEVSSTTF